MHKTLVFLSTLLVTMFISSLSWTVALAQGVSPTENTVPMTCSIRGFDVELLSNRCKYDSDRLWPADETPYFGITQEVCCAAGPPPNPMHCSTERTSSYYMREFTLERADGESVPTTVLEGGLDCHNESLIIPRRQLTTGLYSLNGSISSPYGGYLDFDFEVVDESDSNVYLPIVSKGGLFSSDVTAQTADLDCSLVDQIPQSECQALVDIYQEEPAFFLRNRRSWLGSTEPCDWRGVYCRDGHVAGLGLEPDILGYANEGGAPIVEEPLRSLPSAIGNLPFITGLNLKYNSISNLPPEIGNLSNLINFSLNGNQLTTLPSEIRQFTNIENLTLYGNYLQINDPELLTFLREKAFGWSWGQRSSPTLNSFEFYSDDTVQFTWGPIEDIGYNGEYYTYYEISTATTDVYTIHGTTYHDSYMLDGLSPGATYKIRFRAYIPIVQSSDESWELVDEYWSDYRAITLTLPSSSDTLLPFSSCDDAEGILQIECEALLALYHSTNGPNWVNRNGWLETNRPCDWKGVSCKQVWDGTSISYVVEWLYLDSNGLIGTLSPEVIHLSNLLDLTIDDNHISVTDSDLLAFLEAKTLGWADTQIIIPSPAELTATHIADNKVLFSWTPVDPSPYDGSQYEISIVASESAITHTEVINDNHLLADVEPNTKYEIRVRTYVPESRDRSYAIWSEYTDVLAVTLPSPTDTPFYNCSVTDEIPQIECEALIALYQSTDGPNWVEKRDWLETITPCSWFGVVCEDGHVVELRFDSNELTGPLPSEIADFSQLRTLDADTNHLTEIPSEIMDLSNLTSLYLRDNRIVVTDLEMQKFLTHRYHSWPGVQFVPPTELFALSLTNHSIGLLWTPVDSLSRDRDGYYEISLATADVDDFFSVYGKTSDQIVNSYVITGLMPATSYQVRVRSYFPKLDGTWSDYTDVLSVTLPSSANSPLYDCSAITEIPQIECEALVAIYNSADGPNWTSSIGWLETAPCSWEGVRCTDGHVTGIFLWGNRLSTIPAEISNLTDLDSLDISYNLISVIDEELVAFLDEKSSGWAEVQYAPPTDFTAPVLTDQSIQLGWTLANFSGIEGYYEISIATDETTDAQFTIHGATPDLVTSSYIITGLESSQTYQVRVRTHYSTANTVSNYTDAISVTLPSPADSPHYNYDCSAVSEIPQSECEALVALYSSTDGPKWEESTGWLGAMPCGWQGVECDEGHVISLDLSDRGLAGAIPPEIGDFSQLTWLHLGANELAYIPPEIGNLANLEHLNLWNNQLQNIPIEISNLTALTYLSIAYNYISTVDEALELFLEEKDRDWSDSQLFLPTDLRASTPTDQSIELTWAPVVWEDEGYYEISIAPERADNEVFTIHWTTYNIRNDRYTITGLEPSTTYQIRLRVYYPLRSVLYNDSWSDYTDVLSVTLPPPFDFPFYDCGAVSEIPESECTALLALFQSTDGPHWKNNRSWWETMTPCSWYGVVCTEDHVTTLELYENNLVGVLPAEIGALTNLTTLYLNNNQLTGIPPEIGELTNLQILYLYSNQLSDLLPEIGNLANLKTLYLQDNQLNQIPPEIDNLANLAELNLSGNPLRDIPVEIGNLENLQRLHLNQTPSNIIPPEIGNLANLITLSLEHNQLTVLPVTIGNLSSLNQLYLSFNYLESLPTTIGNLSSLNSLDLAENQLKSLPSEIVNLSNLERLNLAYNGISTVDDGLTAFLDARDEGWQETQTVAPTKLESAIHSDQSIQLSWQPIAFQEGDGHYEISIATDGPFTVHGLTVDKSIDSYVLTELMPDIPYKIRLRTYMPAHNSDGFDREQPNEIWSDYSEIISATIVAVPECMEVTEIPYEECGALVSLYKNNDGPNWNGNIGWLETSTPCDWYGVVCDQGHVVLLNLIDNGLVGVIGPEIADLTDLVELRVNSNQLSSIAPEIGQLTYLMHLRLSDNQLTSLPNSIGELSGLRTLNLQRNQLRSLPPEVGNLPELVELRLDGNRLKGLPSKISTLSNLTPQGLSLAYNRISANNPALQTFLDEQDSDWADTQTVAPTPITATALSGTTIQLTWAVIPLQLADGYYEVSIAAEDAEFTVHGVTANAAGESYMIDGLSPSTAYEIRLRTYTPAHEGNRNALWSEYSDVVSVMTLEGE